MDSQTVGDIGTRAESWLCICEFSYAGYDILHGNKNMEDI